MMCAVPFAWRRRWTKGILDVVLGFVLTMLAVRAAVGASWAQAVPLLLMTVPLAWRRRLPVPSLAVVAAGALWATADSSDYRISALALVCLLVACYSAAAYVRRPVVSLIAIATVAGLVAAQGGGWPAVGARLAPFGILGSIWCGVTVIRQRDDRASQWRSRAQQLERVQELERELMLRDERSRIARELHDIVTHAVSVMTLQTGAARRLAGRDLSRATEILEAVEGQGREALNELRGLLGLLTGDEDAPLAPQPSIADLPALVQRLAAAGLDVTLTIEGEKLQVPPGIELAAYRIVQEALTNSMRYANGAPTRVMLRFTADEIAIDISDEGTPADAPAFGRGLMGMRERASLYGGTVDAIATSAGFTVHALLPLTEAHG